MTTSFAAAFGSDSDDDDEADPVACKADGASPSIYKNATSSGNSVISNGPRSGAGVSTSVARVSNPVANASEQDESDDDEEEVECSATESEGDDDDESVSRRRWDQGITIRLLEQPSMPAQPQPPTATAASDNEKLASGDQQVPFWHPISSFDALRRRGASTMLVDRCRTMAGIRGRPTAVQAECWGFLLLPSSNTVATTAASVASNGRLAIPPASGSDQHHHSHHHPQHHHSHQHYHHSIDVPVSSDSDSDLDEPGARSTSNDIVHVDVSMPSLPCRIREASDLVAVAPTGSGKTLAFMVPLLADGLCETSTGIIKRHTVFNDFEELFPLSFPLEDSSGNAAVLDRCRKLHNKGSPAAVATVAQIAAKAANGKDDAVNQRWRKLGADCSVVGLVVPLAVVLSPTRELAMQVADVAKAVGASSSVVIGGVDHEKQRQMLQDTAPALIVATPGRLRALCGEIPTSMRRHVTAASVETPPVTTVALGRIERFVMDEGDRLLDEGFSEDVGALVGLAKARRVTMLFTATWSNSTETLTAALRPAAVHLTVMGIPRTIVQDVELIPKVARGKRLRELLHEFGKTKVLVFVLFKAEAKELALMLASEGFAATALQGNMSQAARTAALQHFRDNDTAVLVATDVAARGLDVGGVKHVINFSLGLSMDNYVHRIGRCGRAGRSGTAVTFVTDGDERHAGELARILRQCGQQVPSGLASMATMYEKSGGSVQMQVKYCGARGEVKLVANARAGARPEIGSADCPVSLQPRQRGGVHGVRGASGVSCMIGGYGG